MTLPWVEFQCYYSSLCIRNWIMPGNFFFQIILGLNTLGINRLLLDSQKSDPVNLYPIFTLISSWGSLPCMIPAVTPPILPLQLPPVIPWSMFIFPLQLAFPRQLRCLARGLKHLSYLLAVLGSYGEQGQMIDLLQPRSRKGNRSKKGENNFWLLSPTVDCPTLNCSEVRYLENPSGFCIWFYFHAFKYHRAFLVFSILFFL